MRQAEGGEGGKRWGGENGKRQREPRATCTIFHVVQLRYILVHRRRCVRELLLIEFVNANLAERVCVCVCVCVRVCVCAKLELLCLGGRSRRVFAQGGTSCGAERWVIAKVPASAWMM